MLNYQIFKSSLVPSNVIIKEYMKPLFVNCPSGLRLQEASIKDGEPLVGFCLTGGTEKSFLDSAMRNPNSPAVILVHNRANSFAAGLELSARLRAEHRKGKRAASVFCSIHDSSRLRAVLTAASVSSEFTRSCPNIGVIGEPSPWLVATGRLAESLPALFNMRLKDISMKEFLDLALNKNVERALDEIVSKYRLSAFTVRCFDLLDHKMTSCLEVSKFNDRGITAACEGDIASCVTMHIMKALSNSPVFMANVTGIEDNVAMFAHCTIPRTLCTSSRIQTHYESGLGAAVCGKVKEGTWTMAKLSNDGNIISEAVEVHDPITNSPHHCRTQMNVIMSQHTADLIRKGETHGNHFLFVPGNITQELEVFVKTFRKCKLSPSPQP